MKAYLRLGLALLFSTALILQAADADTGKKKKEKKKKEPLNVLIVGGGSSHDFNKFFNEADKAILESNGLAKVTYTDKVDSAPALIPDMDVLYLSLNQPMPDPALRKAIMGHLEAGKGLVLVHPALWYNYADWPEYNSKLVGGGARSHNKYGQFEVTVTEPANPIMKNVPPTFSVQDEFYHFEQDMKGSPIHVLATAKAAGSDKVYSSVWTTEAGRGRVVCIALGHDGATHTHPAYQALLRNSIKWAGKKQK